MTLGAVVELKEWYGFGDGDGTAEAMGRVESVACPPRAEDTAGDGAEPRARPGLALDPAGVIPLLKALAISTWSDE